MAIDPAREANDSRRSPAPRGQTFRVIIAAIALIAVAARLYLIFTTHATEEDYYITLRYGENLAHGLGLVYNPGEHVLGTTTPLYTLLIALFARIGLNPVVCGKLCAVAADALSCWFIVRLADRLGRPMAGLCAAVCFAILPLNLTESVKGMESSLVACAGIAVWALFAEGRQRSAWLCAALLTLLRIDGAALAVLLLLSSLWRERKPPWQGLAVYAVVTLPWLLYAGAVFGSPIPTSLRAKLIVYGWHSASRFPNLLPFLKLMTHNPVSAILFVAAAMEIGYIAWRLKKSISHGSVDAIKYNAISRKDAKTQRDEIVADAARVRQAAPFDPSDGLSEPALGAMVAWMLIYYAGMAFSKVFLFGWYFLPPTPEYYLVAFLGLGRLAGMLPARYRAEGADAERNRTIFVIGVGIMALAVTLPKVAATLRESQRVENDLRIPIGRKLKELARPGETVMLEPIGYIGYYSGLRVLDTVGLVSPEVLPLYQAQEPSPYHAMWRKFHPEWVLLRAGELAALTRYEASLPPSERLEASYRQAGEWGKIGDRDRSTAQFTLFRRTSQ